MEPLLATDGFAATGVFVEATVDRKKCPGHPSREPGPVNRFQSSAEEVLCQRRESTRAHGAAALSYALVMAAAVEFTYELVGTGWSEGRLTIGDGGAQMSVSYLDDALRDLLEALAVLARRAESAGVSWRKEPGEYLWSLSRDAGIVRVVVVELPDWQELVEADEGTTILDESCQLVELVRAIASAARGVLDQYGEQGYRRKWAEHDFPVAQLEELEAWLEGGEVSPVTRSPG